MDKGKWKDFGLLNAGTLLVAAGVYFFKFPNNFSTGGVSGISLILSALLKNYTPGTIILIINIALLLIGYLVLGKSFGIKTAYSTILMSGVIRILEIVWPMSAPMTDEPLLELMFAVMLPAFGSAILFNIGASTGGTDIVAMLLRRYTNANIGVSLLTTDFVITLAAFAVFGPKTGLFSILGLGMKALVVDSAIENFNLCKYFTIVTTKPDPICTFISNRLHRGATTYDATGAFTHEHKTVVLTVLPRAQALLLQRYVREIDPESFIFITNTSGIIGKGFRGVI